MTIQNHTRRVYSPYDTFVKDKELKQQQLLEEMQEIFNKYTYREREIAAWVALQMALNPIMENLILMDRFLYLEEGGKGGEGKEGTSHGHAGSIRAELLPIFDVTFSPRNVCVVAHKYRKPTTRTC